MRTTSDTIGPMWRHPFLAILLAAGAAPADGDPLLALLGQDDEAARRGAIRELLQAGGGDGCARLSGYSRARDSGARENAVRTMGDFGCSSIDDYRPYFSDGSAWVADALLDAVSRNRVEEGVPYALARLDDRRRLVSDGGSWTLAQAALRALRTLTGQPIPTAAQARAEGASVPAEAVWRAWYAAHRDEPPAAWIISGVTSMREALAGHSPARRLAALETAALIGEPGQIVLVEALRRKPSDLTAALSCTPDEPPRVTDEVPCVLTVKNSTLHRVALASGDVDVEVALWVPPATEPRTSGRERDPVMVRTKPKGNPGPSAKAPAAGAPISDPGVLAGRIVDLGPGESLRRQLRIGPVEAAGRYEVKVELADLWESLDPGPYLAPPLESALVLRFEQ